MKCTLGVVNVHMAVDFFAHDRSKNMESPSINMKFSTKNFAVDERGAPLIIVIGLIKSFSFACKSEATRIVAFPQKCSAFRLSQG